MLSAYLLSQPFLVRPYMVLPTAAPCFPSAVFSPSLYGATYSDAMFTAVFPFFLWLLIFRSPFVKVYYLFIYIYFQSFLLSLIFLIFGS